MNSTSFDTCRRSLVLKLIDVIIMGEMISVYSIWGTSIYTDIKEYMKLGYLYIENDYVKINEETLDEFLTLMEIENL